MQVSVSIIDASVDNSNYDVRYSGGSVPGVGGVYVTVWGSGRRVVPAAYRVILAYVIQRPLQRIKRVAGGFAYRDDVIELGVFDVRMVVVSCHCVVEGLAGVKLELQLVYSVEVRELWVFGGSL